MRPRSRPLSCRIHPPAKLNLCLELLGRNEDGFHRLRSLMVTIGWRDTLRLTADDQSERLDFRVAGEPSLVAVTPCDETNLAMKALGLLRRETGVHRGARVELVKRIPSQAGLGGGSSDAAAALVAGNRVWELGLPHDRLISLAAELGSDVPFFVSAIAGPASRAAVATGRGEEVRPVPGAFGLPVVVVKPKEGLSTAKVYGACRPEDYVGDGGENRTVEAAGALAAGDWRYLATRLTNGLQAAATRLAPWLGAVRDCFDACGCSVHQLSGSGSAYFGLFRSMGEARRVAARLRALRVGQVLATTIA